ncbi:MAG: thiamine pyrophosphate-dependent enzyme [Methanomicrobiales archaeon]|nr:thiamine pyrophosphate-dependent enzyme [Methanomicrobiales archaeon]MDI6875888.1 thiamine pyrophosphate-dependent enzyme [Methanomicrobiales archaeon]
MNGTRAVAAAIRRSADTCYTVPGYPVTALASRLSAEGTINEKVALEYALGDSLSGKRSAVLVKNVGLNACADPLVNATTQGLRAGVVIVAGDDVDVLGSQNAEDSRYYGELAQVPVLEPDAGSCHQAVEEAFRASERFSRIAILRLTPALLESDVPGGSAERASGTGALADPNLTMAGRVAEADRVAREMFAWSRTSPLNRFPGPPVGVGAAPGQSRVVTVYPPPAIPRDLEDVREYGRPFVQEHRDIRPPPGGRAAETFETRGFYRTFCPSCPFKSVMEVLQEKEISAICDMGCSVFAMNPPYRVGIATYGLGSSVAVAARSTRVALTGDFALLHSGINALIDVAEKELPLLCIVLANRRMGMVGGEPCTDVMKYIGWTAPETVPAGDKERIRELLRAPESLSVVVITGECPSGETHATLEC